MTAKPTVHGAHDPSDHRSHIELRHGLVQQVSATENQAPSATPKIKKGSAKPKEV